MKCNNVFSDYISNCQEEVIIYAGLRPSTNYQWVITDKFDNEYAGSLTTELDGSFIIPVEDLPEGLLTSFGGNFFLQVKEIYSCADVPLFMTSVHEGISFSVRGGNREKNTIGCECPNASYINLSGNCALFLLNDGDTEFNLTWTDLLRTFYGNAPAVQVFAEVTPGSQQYELINVSIIQNRTGATLDSIEIDLGGPVTSGYVTICG